MIARLEAQSPYNVARLIKPPPDGGPDPTGAHYERARDLFAEWVHRGVLLPDRTPGLYPYSQAYTIGDQPFMRRGFVALGDVRDAALLTHEETHPVVREDRVRLRRATAADFGIIFMIYSDPAQAIDRILRDCEQGMPLAVVDQPDGSTHRLYRCVEPERMARIVHEMTEHICVVADGHHRTAAAFDTWRLTQDEEWAYATMAFFNAEAPGMTVLPIHRAIDCGPAFNFVRFLDRLADWFEVTRIPLSDASPGGAIALLEGPLSEHLHAERVAFGMVGPPRDAGFLVAASPANLSSWPWPPQLHPACRELPTAIFETGVLRASLDYSDDEIDRGARLDFPKDAGALVSSVWSGRHQLGFLLPPTPLDAVFSVAQLGQNLPQKSTFFFPKLLSGLVVHRIDSASDAGPE